jgi:aminoglycoside 6'-N-acetyltransferase
MACHDGAMEDPIVRDGDLAIRRMLDDAADYDLIVRWRNMPHVAEWWDTDDEPAPITYEHAVAHYGPRTDPQGPATACIVELAKRPVGYLQFYRWDDFADVTAGVDMRVDPGTFGLDILIGEPDLIGSGVGSRAVAAVCAHLFERGAPAVALLTAEGNLRAQRAYEKAGMRKVGRILDTDVRDGERVPSWLMVIERPGLPS